MTLDYIRIPTAILRLKDLNLRQKLLLALVISFGGNGLKMGNEEIAELLGIWPCRVSGLIKDLQVKDYVQVKNSQSRWRTIYLSKSAKVDEILLITKSTSKKALLITKSKDTFHESENITKRNAALNKEIYRGNSELLRLAQLLLDLIVQRKKDFRLGQPDCRERTIQRWARDIDLMVRRDHRSIADIEAVIRWVQADPFWQNNILSGRKLREPRERFDQLQLKMGKQNGHRETRTGRDNQITGTFVR